MGVKYVIAQMKKVKYFKRWINIQQNWLKDRYIKSKKIWKTRGLVYWDQHPYNRKLE